MVYGFVRQSNGHVRIDSLEGKGTTVSLYLPRAEAAVALEIPADRAPVERTAPTVVAAKILVVEDASDVRDIAVTVLRKGGFVVLEAPDASTALDILARDPEIALVFTDVVMPGTMNGMDLARTIAERWPSLRLILTSGYAERLTEREWLPPDVGFLRKPYRPLELIGKVRSAVEAGPAQLH
jgi:CheY-like chemotaxis protein